MVLRPALLGKRPIGGPLRESPRRGEKLELTFNHDGRDYDLGTGNGHIASGVDDLDRTLARLAEQGIEREREPYCVREGGSRLVSSKTRIRIAWN